MIMRYQLCFDSNGLCPSRSECLYHSLLDLLKSLIRKTRRCQYLKLLRRHCSSLIVRSSTKGDIGCISKGHEVQRKLPLFKVLTLKKKYARSPFSSNLPVEKWCSHVSQHQEECPRKPSKVFDHQFELNRSYCKHKQVASFIWSVCRNIVPLDLLGAPSNWRAFQRNLSKFVQLRRFEKFCLRQCTHGLKTSCFSFLSKITQSFHCICTHSIKDVAGESTNMLGEQNKFNDAKLIFKNKLFESWIFWFFSDLVVPMVCANFYVTESETGKQDIFYYRKPIWKELMNRAISSLKEQSYRLLDHASLGSILSKRSFGFSKVRFLPKENGVRPLANLKAPCKALLSFQHSSNNCSIGLGKNTGMCWRRENIYSKSRLVHFRSVNSFLRDLYVVLKGVKAEHPEQLGSSVFDYNDVYKKLCPFFVGLRNGLTTLPRVFVVICDVSKAFDSIDQDKLLAMMKDVLNNDEYFVKRYARILCAKTSLRIRYDQVLVNQSGSTDITKCAAPVSLCSSHSVLVDQRTSKMVKRGQLYHQLCEHVKRNILQLGRDFYLQEVGIPQGSVLSSLLCSFYYACLERDVILPYLEKVSVSCTTDIENYGEMNIGRCLDVSTIETDSTCHGLVPAQVDGKLQTFDLENRKRLLFQNKHVCQNDSAPESSDSGSRKENLYVPKSLLLRLIDDFLFISTSERHAKSFFFRLRRGSREYNCSMNNEKFCMNFDPERELASKQESGSKRMYTGEDGISFLPWSGLLINSRTVEIQADYTRYLGIHMSSTLTVSGQANPGFHLKSKLCDYMRPKCHPIFYDSNINSPAIVRLNAYQAFLLCAMKFHCYVRAMPKIGSLSPNKYLEIIQRSIRYMYHLIKKRMHTMKLTSNLHPILRLKKNEVEWLGLYAYIQVLRKKQSRYTELLSLLRYRVGSYARMEDTTSDLKYAVDDTHSSLFWKIKY